MNTIKILYYHRINNDLDDYNFTNVVPNLFEKQMKYLWNNYRICRLNELLLPSIYEGNEKIVIITFDDGYADVINNALPILEKYSLPSTCFITTENIEKEEENWTDAVIRAIFQSERFSDQFRVLLEDKKYEYRITNLEKRVDMYRSIRNIMGSLTGSKRKDLVNQLNEWAGLSGKARESRRIMNKEEIIKLSNNDLIDIGAHTVSHPFLTLLSKSEMELEIMESKKKLEDITGKEINSIAYPFGLYSEEIIKAVQTSGYKIGVTCNSGDISQNDNMLILPRYDTWNFDIKEFESYLNNVVFM